MTERIAYSIPEAAEAVSQSTATIRRAIKATDPKNFPPPLKAKTTGKAYLILRDDLLAWANSLADA